jgi:hypothetical protein
MEYLPNMTNALESDAFKPRGLVSVVASGGQKYSIAIRVEYLVE